MLSNEIWHLTSEEIEFVKARHTKKQLAFALLFKSYQSNHEFINDLTKLPRNIIKKVASMLSVPPIAGEISSNHEKAQTLSVQSLHLLQLSMVYINTVMIQQIIEEHNLKDILTIEDKRALTLLIYEHVNPYGLFPLDLSVRLPHFDYRMAA